MSLVCDIKCNCEHWGHEHPLYNSNGKRQCQNCECIDYAPSINEIILRSSLPTRRPHKIYETRAAPEKKRPNF